MSALRRLPIRLRLTLVFAAGTALILAAVGVFVYSRMAADLLAATDTSLAGRADALAAPLSIPGSTLGRGGFGDSDESFAQVVDRSGRILASTPVVARARLLPPAVIGSVAGRTFVERKVPGVENVARMLVEPVSFHGTPAVLMVANSLQDREDALLQLAVLLGIGGPVALALMALAGWLLAGALLRPVERMRQEADAISMSEPDRRLTVPDRDDEVARLGTTLNSMLRRLNESFDRERRFLDDASHELRTPLTVLKAELDLALLRNRTQEELRASLGTATEETDRVVRLAEDLLVLSRAHGGRLEIHREPTPILSLLSEACARHRTRAQASGVRLEVGGGEGSASVDRMRIRQALDNLLDNALGHTPPGGKIRVHQVRADGTVRIVVEDSGSGFDEGYVSRAFEPFSRGPDSNRDGHPGAGLGLAIVQAIVQGHGGSVAAENRAEGGSRVTLILPDA
jgi:heavy metal sensor kinase